MVSIQQRLTDRGVLLVFTAEFEVRIMIAVATQEMDGSDGGF